MRDQLALEAEEPSDVERLAALLSTSWPAIERARRAALAEHERLSQELTQLVVPSTSIVVFGSLARREWTQGSDLDWSLLLDGPADPQHHRAARQIGHKLMSELKVIKPGATGAFGGITSSHDLIHKIGGLDDTNVNLTQRNLLLLESVAVGSDAAYKNVVRNVLRRYVEEDLGSPADTPYRVPRFLLNDIARYWRTLAVDFAQKRRDRDGDKWAIRVTKLRMSRKLIFSAGLVTCYSCVTDLRKIDGEAQQVAVRRVVQHLEHFVGKTSLDIMAGVIIHYSDALGGIGRKLFTAYDAFLAVLDDSERRDHLKRLKPEKAEADSVYRLVRTASDEFQAGLTELFFDARETPFPDLTRKYGVF